MKNPFSKKKAEGSSLDETGSAQKKNIVSAIIGGVSNIIKGLSKYKISFHIEKREAPEAKESLPVPEIPAEQSDIPEAVEGLTGIEAVQEQENPEISGQADLEMPVIPPEEVAPQSGDGEATQTPESTSTPDNPDTSTSGGGTSSSGSGGKTASKAKPPKQPKQPKEKQPKQPKEKPVKEKAAKKPVEKKPKAAKQKQEKTAEEDGAKKKPPVLLIGIIGGVIAIGGGIFAALMLMGGDKIDYERIFETAETLRTEEDFGRAQTEYNRIINAKDAGEEFLISSYIGLAETYISMNIMDTAIQTLEGGFEVTGAPEIKERLDEILKNQSQEKEPEPEPVNVPMQWSDPALEKMVRMALGFEDSKPVMVGDVEKIKSLKIVGGTHAVADDSVNATNSVNGYTVNGQFYSERGEIKSLADLKYFKNLRKLVVCYNQVSDISGISELKYLETLGLYANNLTDISGISGLPGLRYLYVFDNSIEDISPIKELPELTQLYAQYNKIHDLAPLKGHEKLAQIYLNHNELTDISVLKEIPRLRLFYADNNFIKDVSILNDIPTLSATSFKNNPIERK